MNAVHVIHIPFYSRGNFYNHTGFDTLYYLMKTTNRIIRSPLSEQAAQTIKAWLFSLQLKPGERLIVDNLADKLAISRTPIREGLQKLVSEGLIVYDGKSYTVVDFSQQDAENLFEIRRALEVLAARQASHRMPDEELTQLQKLLETWVAQQQESAIEFFISQDREFHQRICKGACNVRLHSLLDNLIEQCWWVTRLAYLPQEDAYRKETLLDEHFAILQSLKEHDADGAALAMERHLLRSETEMLECLK